MSRALVAGVSILAGSAALIFWQTTPEPIAATAQQGTAQPSVSRPVAAPIRTTRLPPVRLVGLLHQGNASSAVLEVAGLPARTFHAGDAVTEEWRLRKIGETSVVLADAGQELRLELDANSVNAQAQPTRPNNAAVLEPLGRGAFQGEPSGLLSDEVARERNQQFVEAMRRHAAASGSVAQ